MSTRAERLYGANDVDALFQGSPSTIVPWPRAGGRKDRRDYDPNVVTEALKKGTTQKVDPRILHATQSGLTRAGVQHYLGSDEVYKDQHQAGNQKPVVYNRNGEHMILSGHHRAARSLLRGEQFDAIVATGDYGPEY
jgi:hypothetical protein